MENFAENLKWTGLPRVVLAGRPNVGKSTLFNRLSRQRRSITSPVPGVTRDCIESDVFIVGRPVRLIDTGGFKLDRRDTGAGGSAAGATLIDELVIEKTLQTIRGADLIILMFSAEEFTAEDEEFTALLRGLGDRIIPVVNKTEGGRFAAEAYNLLSKGFKELHLISAEHGDNVSALANAIVSKLDFSGVKLEEVEKGAIKIALAGKPNTGKSTLSNRLLVREASIVSEVPGTTRDIIEGEFTWKGNRFTVLDTAGIRRKSKVEEDIEYYSVNRAIKAFEAADIVILMIEAPEGLSDQDKKIAALAGERGAGIIFALNKWDLMPGGPADGRSGAKSGGPATGNVFNAVRDRIHYFFGKMEYAPIVPVSAKTGDGVARLLDTAVKMYGQLNRSLATSTFNELLEKWQREYPPPAAPNTRFKIKYGTQTGIRPPVFKLFVSRPQCFSASYQSYICNKIRSDAGFSMLPVKLEISR